MCFYNRVVATLPFTCYHVSKRKDRQAGGAQPTSLPSVEKCSVADTKAIAILEGCFFNELFLVELCWIHATKVCEGHCGIFFIDKYGKVLLGN